MRATVVVPTCRRPDALRRCLDALAAQDGGGYFEVVVVDDAPEPDARVAAVVAAAWFPVTLLHGRGRGAAAARNAGANASTGELLVFLDGDSVPAPGWLAAHRRHHGGAPVAVVGPPLPVAVSGGLAERAAASWWQDELASRAGALAPADVDLLSGNLSLPRELFLRLGGFDEGFGTLRREDFELGLRLHDAGTRIVTEPTACVGHELGTTTEHRLLAAQAEGAGDRLMSDTHPAIAAAIAVRAPAPPRLSRLVRLSTAAWRRPRGRPLLLAALTALERAGLRRVWLRLFRAAHEAAWRTGAGPVPYGAGPIPPLAQIDLAADGPVTLPPGPAGLVEVLWDGRRLGRAHPPRGRYDDTLPRTLAHHVPADVLAPDDLPVPEVRTTGLAELLERGDDELVLLSCDGIRPEDGWLGRAAAALTAADVALVVGAPGTLRPGLFELHSRRTQPSPHTLLNVPPRHVLLRPPALTAAGVSLERILRDAGPVAAVLDLAERALTAGLQVGILEPTRHDTVQSREASTGFWRARALLEARDARSPIGYLRRHVVVSLVRISRTGRRAAPRRAGAYAAGATEGLRRRLQR